MDIYNNGMDKIPTRFTLSHNLTIHPPKALKCKNQLSSTFITEQTKEPSVTLVEKQDKTWFIWKELKTKH